MRLFDLCYYNADTAGAGGQNVNKVNTKATLRMEMDKVKDWMPEHVQEAMRETVGGSLYHIVITWQLMWTPSLQPYYAKASDSLVLSSMRHRKQGDNAADCLSKWAIQFFDASLPLSILM